MKYLLLLLPMFAQAQNAPTLSDMLQDRRKWNEVTFLDPPYVSLGIYPGALTTTPKLTIVDPRQDTFPPRFTLGPGAYTITEGSVVVRDCIPFEEFTEWIIDGKAQGIWGVRDSDYIRLVHRHDWVYAEHSDVNHWIDVQTAMYCPCGCQKTDNEARICRVCLEHQTRTRTYGHRARTEESEYVKLKKKAKK